MDAKIKLTDKQKEVIKLMREGYFLYKNNVTSGAMWSLGKYEGNYRWGNINGNVILKISGLLTPKKKDIAVTQYHLTLLGKTIKL